jgi:hypothetical protein
MDLAQRLIGKEERNNPMMKKMTELQKGKIACKYIAMNNSPKKYAYYKRFMDNEGDVQVPGYDAKTGKV